MASTTLLLSAALTLVATWAALSQWALAERYVHDRALGSYHANLEALAAAISFANAIFVVAAVMLEDRASRAYRLGDLLKLILLGPVDLVLYRPLIIVARAKGAWRFLRRDTGWHKFERNARPASNAA